MLVVDFGIKWIRLYSGVRSFKPRCAPSKGASCYCGQPLSGYLKIESNSQSNATNSPAAVAATGAGKTPTQHFVMDVFL
jgi:hypothetical protein